MDLHDKAWEMSEEERSEIELLHALRREEWLEDFYRFNTECLGNHPDTDPGLEGMLDPGVADYIRKAGNHLLDWMNNRHKQTKRRKMMIIVPRECYKSTAFTQALPPWLACHDKNMATIIDCAKLDMSIKMSSTVDEHWKGSRQTSKLVETFGRFYDGETTWNQREKVICQRTDRARKDPSLWNTAVEIGSTGAHVDCYIMDDPITQELMGPSWYDQVWHHYKGTFPVVKKNGIFVLIATRYGDNDLVGRIIEAEIEPAAREYYGKEEFPESDFRRKWFEYAHLAGWDVLFRQVHDEDDNEVFPVVWPNDRIAEIRAIDEAEYASQLQNMPGSRKDSPITQELIDQLWISPHDVPKEAFNKVTVHMDLAWKNEENYVKARGDRSSIQVWLHGDDGTVYYWDGWRGREKMDQGFKQQWVTMLQGLYLREMDPWIMTYDQTVGGEAGASENWFRTTAAEKGFFCPPILQINRKTRKTDRILMAARYWRDRRVRLVRGAGDVDELVYEMLNINYSRHDDMADAAADVFHPEIYRPGAVNPGKGTDQMRPEEVWKPAVGDWILPDSDGSLGAVEVFDIHHHPFFGGDR